MLGLLVIIVISWLLLHFIEKEGIDVLGVIPNVDRIVQFLIGFLVVTITVLVNIYLETLILEVDWKLNTINYTSIFNALVYHFKSALTEDLVFRGAILYILIQRLGAKWAILISALFFGIYHVFSYGMLNSGIISIVYVIFITGFTGHVWAYSFYKTKSIMLGLGFHFGYNLIMTFFFESQPYGELVFSQVSKVNLSEWNGFYFSISKGLFPSFLTIVSLSFLLKYKFNRKQEIVK